ncbi:MAG: BMP family ABC transporter substrate-binding protein [Alphaproteobacteria bacterium]
MKTVKLLKTIAIGAVAAAAIGGFTAGANAEQTKIGFVYVSPIGDAGWTYQHELGRRAMVKALGGKVKATFVEAVKEGADAERVIRKLAAGGNKIIFTTSFGYMNPTIKVAKRFSKVTFMHATGYKRSKNVGTYLARFYEGRYLTGIVAGKMSKSNILGYVAAFPIPEVVRGINAFTIGARSVNPKIQVRVIWISSWFDPGKERQAAETLIAQGADVVTQHTDSTAPVQAAEAKGVFAIGYHSDMSKYGKKAHLTAATHVWGNYYTRVVKAVLAGTWKSGAVWGGIKEGMIKLAPFGPAVPADVRALVGEREKAIAAGTLHPFQGPVMDQTGKVRIAKGSTMSDKAMQGMKWYVQGVVGKLPK